MLYVLIIKFFVYINTKSFITIINIYVQMIIDNINYKSEHSYVTNLI